MIYIPIIAAWLSASGIAVALWAIVALRIEQSREQVDARASKANGAGPSSWWPYLMAHRVGGASDSAIVGPKRAGDTIRAIVNGAMANGWTLDAIAQTSGVSDSTIKGWLLEDKEPTLSRALSVALVIGRRAINSINAIVGYGGATPFEEVGKPDFAAMIPGNLEDLGIIATATVRGGLDHTTEPAARAAADRIIARLLPISSAGHAE